MRLIDADVYAAEMRKRQENCRAWKDSLHEGTEQYARAEQSLITFIEAALTLKNQPTVDAVQVIRCRDCKHYEVKDYWGNFGGVPVLAASDVPTCHKWSDGCVTEPNGYCFMVERRD